VLHSFGMGGVVSINAKKPTFNFPQATSGLECNFICVKAIRFNFPFGGPYESALTAAGYPK
jgi:hypothetical protein